MGPMRSESVYGSLKGEMCEKTLKFFIHFFHYFLWENFFNDNIKLFWSRQLRLDAKATKMRCFHFLEFLYRLGTPNNIDIDKNRQIISK